MTSSAWRPLLEGEDAARARDAVAAIASHLVELEIDDASLYHGNAGVALLHGYLARDGDSTAAGHAADALEAAAGAIESESAPWLARGLSGIGFSLAHLADIIDSGEALDLLDDVLLGAVTRDEWPFDWELMAGLIGIGVYGLERGEAGAGREIAERVHALLTRRAERGATGATWLCRNREDHLDPEVAQANPHGTYSLGFGYGAAGAVAFLAAARGAGVVEADRSILPDGVAWLRGQDRADAPIRFPSRVAAGFVESSARVNGWCFGDPGMAAVLVRAGRAVVEPDWVDHGVAVALRAARWLQPQSAETGDLSLCHGTVGRAHLFNRLAQATGSGELADAARLSYRRALDARRPGLGIGGFAAISRTSATLSPQFRFGLQLGAVGVALGLLAGVSSVPPDWDRAFLVTNATTRL